MGLSVPENWGGAGRSGRGSGGKGGAQTHIERLRDIMVFKFIGLLIHTYIFISSRNQRNTRTVKKMSVDFTAK